jgi:hypothetical protein
MNHHPPLLKGFLQSVKIFYDISIARLKVKCLYKLMYGKVFILTNRLKNYIKDDFLVFNVEIVLFMDKRWLYLIEDETYSWCNTFITQRFL